MIAVLINTTNDTNDNFLIVKKWNFKVWKAFRHVSPASSCVLTSEKIAKQHKHYEKVLLSAFYCCITLEGSKVFFYCCCFLRGEMGESETTIYVVQFVFISNIFNLNLQQWSWCFIQPHVLQFTFEHIIENNEILKCMSFCLVAISAVTTERDIKIWPLLVT